METGMKKNLKTLHLEPALKISLKSMIKYVALFIIAITNKITMNYTINEVTIIIILTSLMGAHDGNTVISEAYLISTTVYI